jgi:plastocyanin
VRRALLVLALLSLPAAGAAAAMEMGGSGTTDVSILFGSVTPANVDIVAGESVDWTNDSVRDHTVTADDGSYDSGTIAASQRFSRMFDSAGVYTYHCRLHPYIRGQVDVHTLLLDRPAQPGAPGRPYPLSGRAALPAGTAVSLEFDDGSGTWQEAGQASVGSDGHFAAQVQPAASGSYRAVAGGAQSPPVDLLVLNRTVTARVRKDRIAVSVTPASPGATVVLQLYLKDHFGWWPVAQRRLGKDSRTTFTRRVQRPVSARVMLTLPDGATVIGMTSVMRLRRH